MLFNLGGCNYQWTGVVLIERSNYDIADEFRPSRAVR